jgi:hypothetical protein
VSDEPNFDRVADVLIRVAMRMVKQDVETENGVMDADTGLLSSLD